MGNTDGWGNVMCTSRRGAIVNIFCDIDSTVKFCQSKKPSAMFISRWGPWFWLGQGSFAQQSRGITRTPRLFCTSHKQGRAHFWSKGALLHRSDLHGEPFAWKSLFCFCTLFAINIFAVSADFLISLLFPANCSYVNPSYLLFLPPVLSILSQGKREGEGRKQHMVWSASVEPLNWKSTTPKPPKWGITCRETALSEITQTRN